MLKLIYSKRAKEHGGFEKTFFADYNVTGVLISPHSRVSFVNLTQNEPIVSNLQELDSFKDIAPDSRLFNAFFKIRKGDKLRFFVTNLNSKENSINIYFKIK